LFKNVGRICLVTSAIKAVAVTLLVIPMTVTLIVLNCDAKNDVSIPDSGYEREDYYS
jgi:hypothetical protein